METLLENRLTRRLLGETSSIPTSSSSRLLRVSPLVIPWSFGDYDRGRAEIDVLSSTVWNCISKACQDVLRDSGISNELVKGIGFDATCSLAVTNLAGSPMSVTPDSWSTNPTTPVERDIILWADHRAKKEANLINASGSSVLKYVGGTMSLEMELPKMLWLKNHMPKEVFEQSLFFDLPDWLTFKATGSMARSNCSLACKCSYVPPGVEGSKGWNAELFTKIGLGEFVRLCSFEFAQLTDSSFAGRERFLSRRWNPWNVRSHPHRRSTSRSRTLRRLRRRSRTPPGNASRIRRHRRLRRMGRYGRCADGRSQRTESR